MLRWRSRNYFTGQGTSASFFASSLVHSRGELAGVLSQQCERRHTRVWSKPQREQGEPQWGVPALAAIIVYAGRRTPASLSHGL